MIGRRGIAQCPFSKINFSKRGHDDRSDVPPLALPRIQALLPLVYPKRLGVIFQVAPKLQPVLGADERDCISIVHICGNYKISRMRWNQLH